MMNILVDGRAIYAMSRHDAIDFKLSRPYVVISIGDDDDRPNFSADPNRLAVNYFTFFDVDGPSCNFRQREAERLWAFVDEYWNQADAVVCHCEYGVSRSPAVAAAITRVKGGVDSDWFTNRSPNQTVYNRLLEAAYANKRGTFIKDRRC